MIHVFIVNGQGKAGKGLFVDNIRAYDKALFDKERIAQTSIIDRVKAIAENCGWHGGKEKEDRQFLYEMKQLLTKYNDLPYQTIKNTINYFGNGLKYPYIFVDAREVEDIDRLKNDYQCTTILVIRGDQHYYGNKADDDVFNYTYDYIIENNGTVDEFKDTCKTFWNLILNMEEQNDN